MLMQFHERPANRLINETSPYLLQHAHNPVDWYPWGDEAFERAKTENKSVLVSIGYSACHWCHVMEHESFENEEIAARLAEIPKSKRIVTHCLTGIRAEMSYHKLKAAGYNVGFLNADIDVAKDGSFKLSPH